MTKAKTKEREPALFEDAQQPNPAKTAKPKAKASIKPEPAAGSAVVPFKPKPPPTNLLIAIAQAAADPACQPEKMHALIDARNRLMAQEAHVAFVTAYIAMQDDLPRIDAKGRIEIAAKRDGGKKQSTPYATFHEINRVTKPILSKHKFSLMMLPDVGAGGAGVLMRGQLSHVCETQYGKIVHVEQCTIAAPLETSGSKNNVQGVGSSLSYTKRYAAVALLNLISEAPEDVDDDGRAAGRSAGRKAAAATQDESPEDGDGGVVLISKENLTTLNLEIDSCGVGFEKFCEHYQITAVANLPADQFNEAVTSCRNYAKNNAKKSAPKQAAPKQADNG